MQRLETVNSTSSWVLKSGYTRLFHSASNRVFIPYLYSAVIQPVCTWLNDMARCGIWHPDQTAAANMREWIVTHNSATFFPKKCLMIELVPQWRSNDLSWTFLYFYQQVKEASEPTLVWRIELESCQMSTLRSQGDLAVQRGSGPPIMSMYWQQWWKGASWMRLEGAVALMYVCSSTIPASFVNAIPPVSAS